jgi:membrane protein
LYGSIGTLLVIMLLAYILSMILLIGFELNASINEAIKHSERIVSPKDRQKAESSKETTLI